MLNFGRVPRIPGEMIQFDEHTPRFAVEELGKDEDQLAGAALIAVRGSGGWVEKTDTSGDV